MPKSYSEFLRTLATGGSARSDRREIARPAAACRPPTRNASACAAQRAEHVAVGAGEERSAPAAAAGRRTAPRGGRDRDAPPARRAAAAARSRAPRRSARHGRARRRSAAPSAGRCWPGRPAGRSPRRSAPCRRGARPARPRRRRRRARGWRPVPRAANPPPPAPVRLPAARRSGRRSAIRAAGKAPAAPPASAAFSRATSAARAAVAATAWRAIASSSPASQAASARPSASSRLRLAIAVSCAATSRAWPGSSAQTSRSRKRRRPAAPSWNSRSICGVSQTAATRAAISAWLRGAAPSRRNTRRSGRPVRRRAGADIDLARGRGEPRRRPPRRRRPGPRRARSATRAPRRPRPGTSREIASSRLVLPLPFGPNSTTIVPARAPGQRGVVAKPPSASGGQGAARPRAHSDPHRHQHIERAGIGGVAHDGRRGAVGEAELHLVADLVGDVVRGSAPGSRSPAGRPRISRDRRPAPRSRCPGRGWRRTAPADRAPSDSFTGRDRSDEIAATRATASAKSFLPTRSTLSLSRGMTRSYSGKVPSISLLVSVTGPAWNWMRVSDSAISTSPVTSSSSLRSSLTVLRGTITPGMPPAPSGSGSSTRARRWPSVATARSTLRAVALGGVQDRCR